MTTAGVVLAAGQGSRFVASQTAVSRSDGTSDERVPSHKLLVDLRGRPLACWAVEAALSAGFDVVYLIQGAIDLAPAIAWLEQHQELSTNSTDLVVLENGAWAEGQATSLRVALSRAEVDGHDAVVVGLADQPLVPATAWRRVADAEAPIAVAVFEGARRPPVKLAKAVWDLVPTEGDAGARSLIRMRPELVSEIPCSGNPVDIDTVKDLQAWS